MKKFTNLAVLLLFCFSLHLSTVFAQSPKMFKYQTVVRNSAGLIVPAQAVAFKISILQGNATGTAVYSETHHKTTNDFGLVNLEIGNGTVVTGTINAINWANGPYFVKVELDITNGSNFITMGTSELLSVPYALYAEKAGTTTYTESDPIFVAHPSHGITATNITNWTNAFGWGNHAGLYRPIGYVPAWSEITGKPNFSTIATSGSYNDLLNKPTLFSGAYSDLTGKPTIDTSFTNELQTLNISNDTIFLSNGGFVKLPIYSLTSLLPPTIINLPASNIQSSSATLNANVNAHGLSTTAIFLWGNPTQFEYYVQNPITGVLNNTVSYNLTGLQGNTTYYYRLKAINAVNTTFDSTLMSFTTLQTVPQLTTTVISSLQALSAISGGNILNDGGATVNARGVCYSTSPNPTLANSFVTSGNGSGTFVSNLTGLTQATTYYIRAYATNAIGTAYGNEISFTTQSGVISIITTTISSITATTATSGGNITADGGSAITARGICWSTNSNPTIANNFTSNGIGIGLFTSNITGLTLGTTYYIRAYATNTFGTYYGNEISFSTQTMPLVITITNVSINATTVSCTGNVTNDGNSTLTSRGICYSTSPNPTIANSITAIGTGLGVFSCNITGLTNGTTYYTRAFATNSLGTSYGNQMSFVSHSPFWSSAFSNSSEWMVSNAPDATISTQWVRLADTSMVSSNWKNYVGPYMGSATPMNGVYYFEGITNLINANYGVSNSKLTKAIPIVTTGHPSVTLKFFQLYKGFNADSTLLEISSDNVNWTVIDVNPTIAANGYAYGWKEYNVSPWAGNKAQVWIRFRFFAPASTTSGAQYGGGYGWMIDDVIIDDMP